ncbi:DUF4010 domain-containing protein [Methylomonas lenta]|uniref:DUF4010 domain-containing protein n=1 Tax=Methylomonas lenta TaxID=980561 RepID=UPI0038BDFDF9
MDYFAIKMFGNRYGSILTDICGGLVLSTVVKLDLSRMAKEYPRMHIALGGREFWWSMLLYSPECCW